MHLDKAGYAYIPEEGSVLGLLGMHNPNDSIIRYTIAHILREEGDVMGYHYDFGDNWWVDIKVLFKCTYFRNPPLNVYAYSLKRLHLAMPAQAPSPYSMVLVAVLQMARSQEPLSGQTICRKLVSLLPGSVKLSQYFSATPTIRARSLL